MSELIGLIVRLDNWTTWSVMVQVCTNQFLLYLYYGSCYLVVF